MNQNYTERQASNSIYLYTLALAALIFINASFIQIPLIGILALVLMAPLLYKSTRHTRALAAGNLANQVAIARIFGAIWIIYIIFSIYYFGEIGLL